MLEQRVVLEDIATTTALRRQRDRARRVEPDGVSAGHVPVLRRHQPRDDPEQCALAGARRARDREAAAVADVE